MPLLVLLHGYGDGPERLTPFATSLGLSDDVELVVPSGEHDGGTGPAWVPSDPSPDEVTAALDRVEGLIAATGSAGNDLVVGGFSQGAAIALALGLRAGPAIRPGAIVGLAGYLFAPDLVPYDLSAAASLRVLLVHGTDDEAVPPAQGRSAARLLERNGLEVAFHEHEGVGHEPSPAFADDVRHWMPATFVEPSGAPS